MVRNILSVTNLVKKYDSQDDTLALNSISFSVQKGEFVSIMGPSGSGKTTLLNMLSSIDTPTTGDITVNDTNLLSLEGEDLATFRRTNIGFIFQDYNLLDTLTLMENVTLPLLLAGKEPKDLVKSKMKLLGIDNLADRFPYQTSGGQQQRAAIARALVQDPSLLLADEPTGNLDSHSSEILLKELASLNKDSGMAIVMVTHDSRAASYANRTIFIKDGKVFGEINRGKKSDIAFYDDIVAMIAKLEKPKK